MILSILGILMVIIMVFMPIFYDSGNQEDFLYTIPLWIVLFAIMFIAEYRITRKLETD